MTDAGKSAPAELAPAAVETRNAGTDRRRVLLVTGLSGAGRTTALKILEDIGYEAIDNPPVSLLDGLASETGSRALAIGVDSRTRGFAPAALAERLDRLKADRALDARLLFLECSDEALRRRFTETRRRHPLTADGSVTESIRRERALLAPLHEVADLVVDTTDLAAVDLRQVLRGHLALDRVTAALSVISFSYRYGLPREADIVFDVRFLRNPHYVPELRDLDGRDPAVARFIASDPALPAFFDALAGLLLSLLPGFEREGKSYLTIGIGCTGGRHRSVYVAERLADRFRERGRSAAIRHRDLGRTPEDNPGHAARLGREAQ